MRFIAGQQGFIAHSREPDLHDRAFNRRRWGAKHRASH